MERASLERIFERFLDELYALPADRTKIIGSHELLGGTIADSDFYIFREQSDSFTRELIEDINFLVVRLHRLEAWGRVLESCSDVSEKMGIFAEFVEPLFEYALTSPYAIKNRFIYCGVKLIALTAALQSPSSPPPIPTDREINFKTLHAFCVGCHIREDFRNAVSELNSHAFTYATREFRHRKEHRLPQKLQFGVLSVFETEITPAGLNYSFVLQRPLRLQELIPMLHKEHQKLTEAFEKYWEMVSNLDSTLVSRS